MTKFTLDRDKLYDAMRMCTETKLYALTKVFKSPLMDLGSIGVKAYPSGEVKLPLDKNRANQLFRYLKWKLKQRGPVVVEQAQLYEPKANKTPLHRVFNDLARVVVHEMFNITESEQLFRLNVHAELDKLVICSGKEIYRGEINNGNKPGAFGSLMIQVPVKYAYGGAYVDAYYKKETIRMELDVHSQSDYYLTAVAGKRIDADLPQEFTIRAANGSPCVMLLADLIWDDAADSLAKVEADRLPQFVEMAYHSSRALSGWRYIVHNSNAEHIAIDQTPITNNTATGHFFIESAVEERLPLLDAAETKALCIPLRGNYCINNYARTSLTGDDALIYKVLTSTDYLDVDLVLMKKAEAKIADWRHMALEESSEQTIEVFKPYSQEDAQLLPISLSTSNHLVGNLNGGITCSNLEAQKCNSCTRDNKQSRYFCAAFLIRPKSSSSDDDCLELQLYSYSFLIDQWSNSGDQQTNDKRSPLLSYAVPSKTTQGIISRTEDRHHVPERVMRCYKMADGHVVVEEQIQYEPTSWAIKDAVVPKNNQLECFLRSEKRSRVFWPPFNSMNEAKRFAVQLVNSSPSLISVDVEKIDGKFVCHVTKESISFAQSAATPTQNNANKNADDIDSLLKESWCYEDAYIPSNRQLERFLKSNVSSILLPANRPIHSEVHARTYAGQLARISPYNVLVGLREVDGGFCCEVVKPRKYKRAGSKMGCGPHCGCHETVVETPPKKRRRVVLK